MLRRELFVLPSLHQLSHTIRLKSPIDYRLLRLSFAIATGMDGESGAGAVAMDDTMLTIEASIPLGATVPVIRLSLSQAATVRWMFGVDARNLLFHQVRRIPREPRIRPGVERAKSLLPCVVLPSPWPVPPSSSPMPLSFPSARMRLRTASAGRNRESARASDSVRRSKP